MVIGFRYRLYAGRLVSHRKRADRLGRTVCLALALCTHAHAAETAAPVGPEVAVMPTTCHGQPNDAIYVALGEDVFRVPPPPDWVGIYPIPYPNLGEIPPTGDAPPGCPDHPAEAFSLHLTSRLTFLLGDLRVVPPGALQAVNISRINHRPYGELFAMKTLAMMVKRHPCHEVDGGLVECTGHAGQKRGSSVLSAQASFYSTPLGNPFIVTCGFGPGIWARDCQVHYQLSERLELRYQINRERVPPARMIDVDRAIRAGIQRLLVNPNQ